jgi:hypothetical protein
MTVPSAAGWTLPDDPFRNTVPFRQPSLRDDAVAACHMLDSEMPGVVGVVGAPSLVPIAVAVAVGPSRVADAALIPCQPFLVVPSGNGLPVYGGLVPIGNTTPYMLLLLPLGIRWFATQKTSGTS